MSILLNHVRNCMKMYEKGRIILNNIDNDMIKKLMMVKNNIDIHYATLIIKTTIKKYIELSNVYLELLKEMLKTTTRLKTVWKESKDKKKNIIPYLSYLDFHKQKKSYREHKEDLKLLIDKTQSALHILLELNKRKKQIKELHFFIYIFLFQFGCDKSMFMNYLYNKVNHFKPLYCDGKDDLCLKGCNTNCYEMIHLFHKDSLISELYSEYMINNVVTNCMNSHFNFYNKTDIRFLKELNFFNALTAVLYYIELDYSLRKNVYSNMKNNIFIDDEFIEPDVSMLKSNVYINKLKKMLIILENHH